MNHCKSLKNKLLESISKSNKTDKADIIEKAAKTSKADKSTFHKDDITPPKKKKRKKDETCAFCNRLQNEKGTLSFFSFFFLI